MLLMRRMVPAWKSVNAASASSQASSPRHGTACPCREEGESKVERRRMKVDMGNTELPGSFPIPSTNLSASSQLCRRLKAFRPVPAEPSSAPVRLELRSSPVGPHVGDSGT